MLRGVWSLKALGSGIPLAVIPSVADPGGKLLNWSFLCKKRINGIYTIVFSERQMYPFSLVNKCKVGMFEESWESWLSIKAEMLGWALCRVARGDKRWGRGWELTRDGKRTLQLRAVPGPGS